MDAVPKGREFASEAVETARELPREIEDLLYDPQTSRGLLIALPESDAAKLTGGWRIGRVLDRGAKPIRLI